MSKKNPLHFLGTLVVLAVFALAAWLLRNELRHNHLTLQKICDSLLQIPVSHIVAALWGDVLQLRRGPGLL